jgi:phosphopantothenoylcysteine decarboxylase / phosphopantothenate---cysteine ligase
VLSDPKRSEGPSPCCECCLFRSWQFLRVQLTLLFMNILVTAGPTREAVDPVRFLSNRSTGKMGYAIASVAVKRGHTVKLISGPVSLSDPPGVEVSRVTTAAEMLEAVQSGFPWCNALVMSAAVADWKPKAVSAQKLKKSDMSAVLELERTVDILQAVTRSESNQIMVGFAAETENLLTEARRKRVAKGLDLVVANDVSQTDAGFEVDSNRVTFVPDRGEPTALPLMSKVDVAEHLLLWIEARSGDSA